MNKHLRMVFCFFALCVFVFQPNANGSQEKDHEEHKEEDHDHAEAEGHTETEHAHEEKEVHEKGKDNHDEHGKEGAHEEEATSNSVGPDKGITEASSENGFKLSVEANKNFGLKQILVGAAQLRVPSSAIYFGLTEKNLYRMRNGFIKRIDFKTLSKDGDFYVVESKDLKPGDSVVTEGAGFLRIAELSAFGGLSEGHSH